MIDKTSFALSRLSPNAADSHGENWICKAAQKTRLPKALIKDIFALNQPLVWG